MSENLFITFRHVAHWRGKKFVYRRRLKGVVVCSPGYFYAPYIPLFQPKIAIADENGDEVLLDWSVLNET